MSDAWQTEEDNFRKNKRLKMGNAWRELYTHSKFFVEQDDDQKISPLLEKSNEIHAIMSDLEKKFPNIDFFGTKRK